MDFPRKSFISASPKETVLSVFVIITALTHTNFYMIWQMMVAFSHSDAQLSTERYGDRERMPETCGTAEDY